MRTVGRYQLLEPIARGGMGEVWRGAGPDGTAVAIKLLLAQQASEHQRRRFAEEVQALLRVRHPGVVAVLDAGESGGRPWLVMEWIEGETLAGRLGRTGPLDPRDAAELVRQLAVALEHCHGQGVLHRDLKPENVLLRARDGRPLLSDFGLALDLARDDSLSRATKSGQFVGTPAYWPPEQARGELAALGPRSDVYGLGAILHAALTARPLRAAETLPAMLLEAQRPPAPPGALRPGVPAWLDLVCARALATDAANRHASASELAAELERGLASRARPRSRALRRAGLALAALAAAGLTAWLALAPRTREPAPAAPAATGTGASAEGELAALLVQAMERVQRGDPRGALEEELVRLLELAPQEPDVWLVSGLAHEELGELDLAIRDHERAVQLGRDWRYSFRLGKVRRAKNDLQGALEAFERAAELGPDQPLAWFEVGMAWQALGEPARSIEALDRAIALDPNDALAFHNRAVARARRGEHALALGDYDRTLELRPAAVGFAGRGNVKLELGDPSGARADGTRAIGLDPENVSARLVRAEACFRLNEWAAAEADLDRALALDPRASRAWQLRATVRYARDDWRGALGDYDRAIELAPGPRLHVLRGTLRAELEDPRGAALDYERALQLDPTDEERGMALAGRGHVRELTGDDAGAEADLVRALELVPPRGPSAVLARTVLARVRSRRAR